VTAFFIERNLLIFINYFNNVDFKEYIKENCNRFFHNVEDFRIGNLSNEESLLLFYHNSGESKRIQSKLWVNEKLNQMERYYTENFDNFLNKIEASNSNTIYRREMNHNPKVLIENLKKCKIEKKLFLNKAFWNFSVDLWLGDHFLIEVSTSKKSNAKEIYKLFGEKGNAEKEVVFKLNSKFEVLSINNKKAHLKEIDF
jgi:hypothetical protein